MIKRDFKEALLHRRSYYRIGADSPVSDERIREAIDFAVLDVPSAFNSQSTRIVLLLGESHKKLWEITKETLRKIVPAEAFPGTEAKIDGSFGAGHGTVLFFEDRATVKRLQEAYPTYSERFPVWAQHISAMHQLAVWTMLEDMGLGASLQHYNPLIDEAVRSAWSLDPEWELVAQMPFGAPSGRTGPERVPAAGGKSARVRLIGKPGFRRLAHFIPSCNVGDAVAASGSHVRKGQRMPCRFRPAVRSEPGSNAPFLLRQLPHGLKTKKTGISEPAASEYSRTEENPITKIRLFPRGASAPRSGACRQSSKRGPT